MPVRGYYSGRLRRRYTAELVSTRLWERRFALGDLGIAPPTPPARTNLLGQISPTPTGNFGTGSFVTNSFTPPSNSLLVVGVVMIENNGTTTDPRSAMTISGGGWSYTARIDAVVSPTSFPTATKIWTAPVAAGASMTLTLGAGGRSVGIYAVSVVAYTGYDTSTPIGATATGSQNGGFTGPPDPAKILLNTGPAPGSEVFGVVGANKSVAGTTPGVNWTEINDLTNTDWGGLESQFLTGWATDAVDWADLRSGGGGLFNFAAAALEIRASATATAPLFVPQPPRARRLVIPWGHFGRSVSVVPAQVVIAATPPVPVATRARLKLAVSRRARAATPVPAQVAPVAPPQSTRARLRAFLVRRRPTATAPPAQPVPPSAVRGRPKPPRRGRPRMAAPAPPQIVVTPPSYVPQAIRARMWAGRLFRGRAATPVPAQVAVTPPPYPPQPSRVRRGFARLFGGHRATPVPPQVILTPTFVPTRRQPPLRAGRPRPRLASPPPTQVAPPLLARVRQRVGRLFRTRSRPVVPPQVVVINPPYPPMPGSARRKLWPLRRRATSPLVTGPVHVCITPRPSTGTTARGASGTTAHATATTARSNTGTTSRLNSGTTENPC
jgi:hypothetical protein